MTNSLTVNTTAVQVPVGRRRPVIVNVGETTIYLGDTNAVTTSNGIPIGPNVGYEFPETLRDAGWDGLWVIGDAAGGEVRYGSVG
jgi:hypothetical protein